MKAARNTKAASAQREEPRRALEVRARSERMQVIGQVAAGVAHDLNNALHVMGMRLEMIGLDETVAEKHGRHLDALKRIIQDAAKTVARLQDFAQGGRNERIGAVSLQTVLVEALEFVRSELEAKARRGRRLLVDAELPDLPPVRGDEEELRTVFVNLLLNARDAMPNGGRISCRAEVGEGTAAVVIEDEGTGIAPENLRRIFDPFFTTKGQRGTGLGLSMAYGVVTRLGGTISAENRDGRGARFRLVFLRADATEPAVSGERAGARDVHKRRAGARPGK